MFAGIANLISQPFLWVYRTFWGGPAVNAVRPPGSRIYLRLQFRDPEGRVRDFPAGYPVRVRFGLAPAVQTINLTVAAHGNVFFDARTDDPWSFFTLEFPSPDLPFFVWEPNLSPPAAGEYRLLPALDEPLRRARRFFSLPQTWEVPQADWSPPPVFAGNGRYNAGLIFHTTSPPNDITIGTSANPVALVLDPHWKYHRFEYFDRYFGPTSLDTPPRAGLLRRVTVPAVELQGFQNDPAAAGSPPDTRSNWVIDPAGGQDTTNLVQCLPWIVRRQPDLNPLPAPFDGAHMGIRFESQSAANPGRLAVVFSQDATHRVVEYHSPPRDPSISPPQPATPLDPGPDRLKYYDLPPIWKSKGYFARGVPNSPPNASPPVGQFFQDLTAPNLALSDAAAQPLVFSLDDIVLTDNTRAKIDLADTERVALFHHRFANRSLSPPAGAAADPNLSNEGIYMREANPPVDMSPPEFPYSQIKMRTPYYITDYPDWTRLVAAQGSLFDVFSERTPDADPVVGARAAVRWVDATPSGVGWGAGTNIGAFARPALNWQPFFAIQPFYGQEYLSRNHNPVVGPLNYNEWNVQHASGFTNGRFDIAHIRCTDSYDGNEIAVVMRYQRFNIDFATAGNGNPYAGGVAGVDPAPPRPNRSQWIQTFFRDVPNRWNGVDDPNSTRRPFLVSSPPGLPLRSHVLTVLQHHSPPRAHFRVRTIGTGGTSAMTWQTGTGVLRINAQPHQNPGAGLDVWGGQIWAIGRGLAAAHEVGHCGGMPDEYRPGATSAGAAPNTYVVLQNYRSNHVLGNPYILDELALMKGNWYIRSRYLWHTAEWLRTLPGFRNEPLMIHHFRGAVEEQYAPPFYRASPPNPLRNYMTWPIRFNLRNDPNNAVLCDSVLYLLGYDEYAREILPNLVTGRRPLIPRAPNDHMDGILVVMVRMYVTLQDTTPAYLSAAWMAFIAGQLYDAVETRFDQRLNGRYCAAFQAASASPTPPPAFRRCLLHFVPCFATNDPTGAAAGDIAASPEHIDVVVTLNGPPNNFAAAPLPGPHQLTLRLGNLAAMPALNQNAHMQSLAERIFDACCRSLGLVNNAVAATPGSYADPASYAGIVQTVMDAGAPVLT